MTRAGEIDQVALRHRNPMSRDLSPRRRQWIDRPPDIIAEYVCDAIDGKLMSGLLALLFHPDAKAPTDNDYVCLL